jgi:hypothetical protein
MLTVDVLLSVNALIEGRGVALVAGTTVELPSAQIRSLVALGYVRIAESQPPPPPEPEPEPEQTEPPKKEWLPPPPPKKVKGGYDVIHPNIIAEAEKYTVVCKRAEEHHDQSDTWQLVLAIDNDFLLFGIEVYQAPGGNWCVELPPGIRITNKALMFAIRNVSIESARDAIFSKRLKYLRSRTNDLFANPDPLLPPS